MKMVWERRRLERDGEKMRLMEGGGEPMARRDQGAKDEKVDYKYEERGEVGR